MAPMFAIAGAGAVPSYTPQSLVADFVTGTGKTVWTSGGPRVTDENPPVLLMLPGTAIHMVARVFLPGDWLSRQQMGSTRG